MEWYRRRLKSDLLASTAKAGLRLVVSPAFLYRDSAREEIITGGRPHDKPITPDDCRTNRRSTIASRMILYGSNLHRALWANAPAG